jgi:UDP-glucose:glycoprotein glucosyltransferase
MLKILASIGSSENDIAEDSTHALSEETDHILQLLQKYPVNDTAVEANVPLTEDELLCTSKKLVRLSFLIWLYSVIGFQSAQLIRDSSTPLETLRELSQNFPKYATTISRRVIIDRTLEEEVKANHEKASPGINMVWLNGAVVDEKDMNPYAYVSLLYCLILSLKI